MLPTVILAYPKIDHERDYYYYWMPFATLTIAKVLEEEHLARVVLYDGNQSSLKDWSDLLDEHLPNTICIGLSVMTGGGQIGHALEMAHLAKEKAGCPPLVFGGPHVNVLAEQTAQHPLVDVVLEGPGQTSMPAYVRALKGEINLNEVPGLQIFDGETIMVGPKNPARTSMLGRYPWYLLNVADYIRDDPSIAPQTLNYVSSQGCVYKCKFCYELTYKRKYSAINAIDLLDDVEELVQKFNIDGVKFYDADWFVDLKRARAFCSGLLERGLDIRWAASINPNDVIRAEAQQPDLLHLLAKSGCTRLLMGVESGSNRVLEEIVDKGVTREQIIRVATSIAAHGIMGSYTFIVGFPGESTTEQNETYDLLNQLRSLTPTPETKVHIFSPYPGTPLYEQALLAGFEPPNTFEGWSNFNYYESHTPWTGSSTEQAARVHTFMTLRPEQSGWGSMEVPS